MFSSALNKKTDFFKKLWKLVTSLIILVSAVECATTTNISGKENICYTTGCEDAANMLTTNMDEKEEPCNDFYNFACGGFIKSTPIPNDEHHIGQLEILKEKIFTQMKEVLEENVDPTEPRIFELAKNYYRSCMDESAPQKNLETLLNIIKKLGGWPLLEGSKWTDTNFEWFKFDSKLRNIGYRPSTIFKFYVFPNVLNTSESLLFIGPPDQLVKTDYLWEGLINANVQAYHKFMTEIAVLLGADRRTADKYLSDVIVFEKILFMVRPVERLIDKINPRLINKLYEDVDEAFPWLEYINNMTEPITHFKNISMISIENPFYLDNIFEGVRDNTIKRTYANYMIWRIILQSIPYLPNEFRELAHQFDVINFETEVPPQRFPRWQECINLLTDKKGGLGVAVSSMYIRRYFREASKKEVEPLILSLADAFKETIDNATWMSDPVKRAALKKLERMRKLIAYPDELLSNAKIDEYSRSLNISPNDHYQNFLNLQRFHYEFELSNLGQPTEVNLWEFFTDSTTINAYYFSLTNTFVLLAAILQRPVFNPEWPSYATFGSMGFIVGHEIMHAYDPARILYNAVGAMTGWLTGESKTVFLNRSQCIQDQYSEYEDKQTGKKLNGASTLNENVADIGGLKIAYRAYRNWVEKHGEDPRPAQLQNYTADQLFYVSAINFICSKSTNARRRDDLKGDVHTPNDLRTLGMLSNSDEFSKVYSCPVGSTMNPEKKCAIWD